MMARRFYAGNFAVLCVGLGLVTSCGYGKTTIEDPLGRKYGVTPEQLAVLDDLEDQGLPSRGFIQQILSVAHAACNGVDAINERRDDIQFLTKHGGFTQDDIVLIAVAADAHLC